MTNKDQAGTGWLGWWVGGLGGWLVGWLVGGVLYMCFISLYLLNGGALDLFN